MATQLSDTNIMSNILNIGRKRERIVYIKPNGSKTLPLPADPQSRMYYMQKGFKPDIPNKELEEQPTSDGKVACPFCEFKTESAFGLSVHLKIHMKKEKVKEEKI